MYRNALVAISLLVAVIVSGCSSRHAEIVRVADGTTVALALEPGVAGETNQISVRLGRAGQPLDARVRATLDMTEMPMEAHPLQLRPDGAGRYVASGVGLSMSGDWRVRIEFTTPGEVPHSTTFPVKVR